MKTQLIFLCYSFSRTHLALEITDWGDPRNKAPGSAGFQTANHMLPPRQGRSVIRLGIFSLKQSYFGF